MSFSTVLFHIQTMTFWDSSAKRRRQIFQGIALPDSYTRIHYHMERDIQKQLAFLDG